MPTNTKSPAESDKEKGPEEREEQPQVPEEVAARVMQMGLMMQRTMTGPLPPQLADKITGEHISRIIDTSENDSQRAFNFLTG